MNGGIIGEDCLRRSAGALLGSTRPSSGLESRISVVIIAGAAWCAVWEACKDVGVMLKREGKVAVPLNGMSAWHGNKAGERGGGQAPAAALFAFFLRRLPFLGMVKRMSVIQAENDRLAARRMSSSVRRLARKMMRRPCRANSERWGAKAPRSVRGLAGTHMQQPPAF